MNKIDKEIDKTENVTEEAAAPERGESTDFQAGESRYPQEEDRTVPIDGAADESHASEDRTVSEESKGDSEIVESEASDMEESDVSGMEEGKDSAAEESDISDIEESKGIENVSVETEGKKASRFKLVAAVIGLILAIAYIGVSVYYSRHFFPHTSIWGRDCSGMTQEEAYQEVEQALQDYEITVMEREDQTESLTSADVGAVLLDDGGLKQCLHEQRCYTWPRFLWSSFSYKKEIPIEIDEEKYQEAFDQLKASDKKEMIEPVDAFYEYSTELQKFHVVAEVYGTTLDADTFAEGLKQAILDKEESYDPEAEGLYENPQIFEDDEVLNRSVEALNTYMTTSISYDFGDRSETVGPDLIQGWITVDKDQDYKVTLSKDKVKEYVAWLAETYDTVESTRHFTSICGNDVTVSGGPYGWKIDQDAEYKKLYKLIKKHAVKEGRKPVYAHNAKCRDSNDLGDTYVEVDLSAQHMWFYKDGEILVSTDVVTGDPTKGHATPTGVYYILYKTTNYTLTGQGYASDVDYWLPYMQRGIGIHDSSWRNKYGGNIYHGDGSHGCVNTPLEAVKKIYENIDTTYPVVVHE